jgi:hypothetical protein
MKSDPVHELASIRASVITYLDSAPDLIEAHGPACFGNVTLNLGKCLLWIGPVLDRYSFTQPLPGTVLPSVAELGERLRRLGLDRMNAPVEGDMATTIATLKRQIELFQKLAELQGGAR